MTDEADIFAAEERRLAMLIASDYAALADLLADDLVHVHANGSVEGKAGFLATIKAQLEFVEMSRGDLDVKVDADVAVATGLLKQTVKIKVSGDLVVIEIFTTQVWRRQAGSWRLSNFHATRITSH